MRWLPPFKLVGMHSIAEVYIISCLYCSGHLLFDYTAVHTVPEIPAAFTVAIVTAHTATANIYCQKIQWHQVVQCAHQCAHMSDCIILSCVCIIQSDTAGIVD
jgi:hypothetical protein